MPWNRWYAFKSYMKSSLWLIPFVALVVQMVVTRLTHAFGGWLISAGLIDESTAFLGLGMAGAQAQLGTIITANLSFMVFTFGSLLVAIQVASGQYTPRIIATTLLRDNPIRFTVGYFVFTMLFALRVLIRMKEVVHQFNLMLASLLGVFSVVVFLYLIDYAAKMLRPVSIVERVGKFGIDVIQSVYPQSTAEPRPVQPTGRRASLSRTVDHQGTSAIVIAVNLEALAVEARNSNGVIELVPQVGDFVAVGEPLFLLYGGAGAIDDRRLREAVAFGRERTLEQDPTFAFRILVDIALKALSPAINDPTTAGLAIDQLHRLLRLVGTRFLRGEEITDDAGDLRVIFRTPNWENFVHLAFTEIRHCGAGSVQIARRLRSMVENLVQTLPEHRHAALRRELALLDRALERHYDLPEDLALARVPDPQGLGSAEAAKAAPAQR